MIKPETKALHEEIEKRAGYLWRYLDVDGKTVEIAKFDEKMAAEGFWNDQKAAQEVIAEANKLKRVVNSLTEFRAKLEDAQGMEELLEEEDVEDSSEEAIELHETAEALKVELDELEIQCYLKGPHDHCNAILSINAGAGGTESCDWADMLFRMYTRWAERREFKTEIIDILPGEEAGLSKVTIRIIGPNAFGYANAERGVHRLVRISPFDSNARRHTSFCAVDVVAEIEDDTEIEIEDKDLREDTYRSSGKGGQHVNKTDSAVRLTHIPTGVVAACQSDRSQHKNRAAAMKMLKARLYEKEQDAKRSELEKVYGEKGEIGWGSQIRSYVFQPYQLVKDLRTGVDSGNLQNVMDGDLDKFINAWLRAGSPRHRNKDIQLDE
ncbi:MAG: peptide chain release factor 2 [Opitutales bacterium]|nr:peptide chain release factor 2 [Opitutales bacterium]MBT5815915.1 peptide chain release factor 2 [Opitutales bacterium]MBT6767424.1 peptide chain release factor 2 [Opitutales bacterium]MDG2253889.1 peptide chain release factor 2 [Opitutaceae bacterium]